MTKDTTRRAMLAGTAAIGTDALLPYARRAHALPDVGADAELIRLEREWEAQVARWHETDRLRDRAAARYHYPKEPEPLFWREGDAELWDAKITTPEVWAGKPTGRSSYTHQTTLTGMRVALEQLRSSADFPIGGPLRERRIDRLEEVLSVHDAWLADRNRAWRESGMEEAERAIDAAYADMIAVRRQIVLCDAATSAGLMVKIRVATWCFGDTPAEAERCLRESLEDEELPTGEALACSILLDIVRLVPTIVTGA